MLRFKETASPLSPSAGKEAKSDLSSDLLRQYRHLTDTENLTSLSIETVKLLLKQHCRTFAFSTLAANLVDETITPEISSLASYLLKNREGLCFHHNSTLREVLTDMGFTAHLIACRFKRPKSSELYDIPTHAAIILTISGHRYLIDPGFGWGIMDLIPFNSDAVEANEHYQIVKKSDHHFEFQKQISSEKEKKSSSKEDSFIYAFDDKPVHILDFQAGINTLKKPDKLMEQGHLFYSLFFYSKIRCFDNKLESVMALSSESKNITDISTGSLYDHLISTFNPVLPMTNKCKAEKFINKKLKDLVFEYQIPLAFRSSCTYWRR